MPLQRNDFISQSLVTIYTSPSQMTDPRTGLNYGWGGSYVGIYFDLTEAEAQSLSGGQCHEGRYRYIQLDSSATASKVKTGTIGLQKTLAGGVNLITDWDQGLGTGVGNIHPVIFLNSPTAAQVAAGVYLFVQEQGDASVLCGGSITAPAGTSVIAETGGVITNGTTAGLVIGVTEAAATASTLCRVQLNLPMVQG